MTEKQRIFADEYIISLNATEAYKKAYPNIKSDNTASSSGHRLLRNDEIKAYIDERLEALQSDRIASQEEILQYLTSLMRGEQTEQTLISEGSETGQSITDIDVSAKDRLKAAELLGKRYALFTDRTDANLNVAPIIFEGEKDV